MNVESMVELVAEQAIWDGLAAGLHGTKHWLRVFKLSDMLVKTVGGNKSIVGLAALLHDIGRVDDGKDADHGFRGMPIAFRVASSIFATGKNQLALATPVGFQSKMVELGKITDIVGRHCLPGLGDYLELRIVKDAEKLDRVRLGAKGLDVKRLGLPESRNLVEEAKRLVNESEDNGAV